MNLREYVSLALETESRIDSLTINKTYLLNVLQTLIAAGNLLDVVKKDTFYGLPTDPEKVTKRYDRLATSKKQLQTAVPATIGGIFPGDSSELSVKTTSIDPRVVHAIIGLATESIELLEALHQSLSTDTPIDATNILEELGDLNWYHAIAVDALQGDWENILTTNIAKLRERNKGNKFNAAATINRDISSERSLLESRLINDR